MTLQKMMKSFMLSRRCSHMGALIKDAALGKVFQHIKSILMLVSIKQVLRSMNDESQDLPYRMEKSNSGGKRVRQKVRICIPGLFMPIHFIFQSSFNAK